MIVDITNEVLSKLKTELVDIEVLTSYQSTVEKFPIVIFEEIDNSAYISTKDSAGFQHSNISFSVEIYTQGSRKMSDAKAIRNKVDAVMSDFYGMTRGVPVVVPNYLDNTIYRYKMRYTGVIDKTKTIYRG